MHGTVQSFGPADRGPTPIYRELAAESMSQPNLQIVFRSRIITGLFGRAPVWEAGGEDSVQARRNLPC